MRQPREVTLSVEARAALAQILGIMTDHLLMDDSLRWSVDRIVDLEARLGPVPEPWAVPIALGGDDPGGDAIVVLGIDDVAFLLDGMAFTEMASADLPWFEMVRWTSDFIAAELRAHWSEAEWQAYVAEPG